MSRKRSAALFLAIVLAALPVIAAGPEPPELILEGPPSMQPFAASLHALRRDRLEAAMRLVGLAEPGPPIHVLLAPEGSPMARSAPPSVSGYAFGDRGVIVLLPSREPSYPESSLGGLLDHEVTHVLIARAAAGRPVPRWFDEGLAMFAGGTWGLDDRGQLALSLLRTGRVPLAELDAGFA